MKEIGGFLELELPGGNSYHQHLLALNSGRAALEYILRVSDYKKVYLPQYHCHVLQTPMKKLGIPFSFYEVNYDFEFEEFEMEEDAVLLYINYFGMKDDYVRHLSGRYNNLIIDNAQSFFSKPLPGVDTLYSCRKFFGVPDGAYLSTTKQLSYEPEQDQSQERYRHLIGRLDDTASAFYSDYVAVENSFDGEDIKRMSRSTEMLLSAIDYAAVRRKRQQNYALLYDVLQHTNKLSLPAEGDFLFYPYLSSAALRRKLIQSKVYIGTYWPGVADASPAGSVAHDLATNLVCIPVDQRYSIADMDSIIKIIHNG